MNSLLLEQQKLKQHLKRTSDKIANLKKTEEAKKRRPEFLVPDRILDTSKQFPRLHSAKIRLEKASNYYEIMRTIEKISEECHEDIKYIKQDFIIESFMATPFPRGSIKCCKYFNSTRGCKNNSTQHRENHNLDNFVNHFCLICFQVFGVAVHHAAVDCEVLKALDKNSLNESMNNLQPYNPSFPMNQDPLGINSSMDTTPFGNPSGQMAEHRYVQNPNQGLDTPKLSPQQ